MSNAVNTFLADNAILAIVEGEDDCGGAFASRLEQQRRQAILKFLGFAHLRRNYHFEISDKCNLIIVRQESELLEIRFHVFERGDLSLESAVFRDLFVGSI